MPCKRVMCASLVCFALVIALAISVSADLRPRNLPDKPDRAAIPPGYDNRHIQVKFVDELDIGLDATGRPYARTGGALKSSQAELLLEEFARDGARWSRLTTGDEQKLDDMRMTAEHFHNRKIADLNTFFILNVPDGIRAEDWMNKLNALFEIEIASPLPLAMPAPIPGSFEHEQGYLDPARDGIDAEYAWTLPGGTGSNVTIYDFEYSWNLAHQDLPSVINTYIQAGYIAEDPFPVNPGNNHGTAVLGELVSVNNGWGTTGASYGAGIAVCPTFLKTTVPGDTPVWALSVAMSYAMSYGFMNTGDVMLIEQQIAGPNYTGTSDTGLVPVEWDLAIYNLVLTAVGNGRHVVMCAGNGYQNLDDPVYNTGHAPFVFANHSGAIYVGAGGVPTSFGGTTGDRFRMPFSNYGLRVDLQGWGEYVVTTGYGTKYSEGTPDSSLYYTGTFNGTSSAAPNVASAVALMSGINEAYNGIMNPIGPGLVLQMLRLTGTPQDGDGFNPPWYMIGPRPDLKTAIRISGITDTLFYKQGYVDYCPSGMPDFSMLLDSAWRGYTRWTYDAPVALANCLWWFDSKFETTPVDPRPFYPGGTVSDNYPLVQSYGAWDDHDSSNVKPLIEDLASIMTTDDTMTLPGLYEFGTWIYEVESCVDTWLTNKGLRDDYTDTVVNFPSFEYLSEQLQLSQNIILHLTFFAADPSNCCNIGAHYVNMVGVDDDSQRIGLCDPYIPFAINPGPPNPSDQNDAANVHHEVYQVGQLTSAQCPTLDGALYLTDYYPTTWMWMNFENINVPAGCMFAPDSAYAVIEYAIVICPTEEPPIDSCEYYKSSYDDYTPNGVPDFDQKQDAWTSPYTGFFSWCGPVALANCAWWFDSKHEPSPVDPRPFYPDAGSPTPNDGYPLVQSLAPVGEWDDHDTCNVMPFIQKLKTLCWTDGPRPGTLLSDLKRGIDSLTKEAGLEEEYASTLIPGPDFQTIQDSVMASRDVILLLGFYELENPPGECIRVGGHYVTCAGVCTEETNICISDPFFDKNCSAHGSSLHNDAYYVSGPHDTYHHDRYHMETYSLPCSSPATWRLTDYTTDWTTLVNFADQNWYDLGMMSGPYIGGQIVVMVDYAMVVTHLGGDCDCVPGDANNDASFNLLDILYLIDYVYGTPQGPTPQPYPLCSGDPNCDCAVNLLDILHLIAHIYQEPIGDPLNCSCENWIGACGEPLRK